MRQLAIHGLMAEFPAQGQLLSAARRAYDEGYRRMDAYSPLPIDGLARALGFRHTRVPLIVLAGGLIGCVGGFYLQYWISAVDYPLNVAGRPYNSWQSFVPITFELTILAAAFAALFGMLALNHLPMPYHPVFNAPRFDLASRDRFFLCIEAADPRFDRTATAQFLESLEGATVSVVQP